MDVYEVVARNWDFTRNEGLFSTREKAIQHILDKFDVKDEPKAREDMEFEDLHDGTVYSILCRVVR